MTTFLTRRTALLAAATCAATLGLMATAYAQTSIKIGYAISRTGPNTGGAAVTTIPNYELWVKEVNAAGGIKLGDKRVLSRSCSMTTAPTPRRPCARWSG